MSRLAFLKDFNKKIDKMENVTRDFRAPSRWYSTGNLAVNKVFSGSFKKGIPESRITCLAGPSGSGKSFIAGNLIKNAQKEGAFCVVLDSENAMDDVFLKNIGASTEPEDLLYAQVVTVHDVTAVTSEFLTGYEKEYGRNNPDAPPVVIVIDSLDMLLTEAEAANFNKGEQKGDQGQRAKQTKHLLRTLVAKIARLNVSVIVTHQVYPADPLLGEGVWAVNNAVRYSCSQIFLITKLKLKDGTEVTGVRMRAEVFKSRFTKLGSKIEFEVPYDKGMNPYSGFLELMEQEGVVRKGGAWYTYVDVTTGEEIKFQKKQLNEDIVNKILLHPQIAEEEQRAIDNIEGNINVNEEIAELEDDAYQDFENGDGEV